MGTAAEALRLRLADDDARGRDSRPPTPRSAGAPCLLALTATITSYPTTAASFYACQPLTLLGPETEGGPGVITPGSGTFFALNLGTTIPPSGTQVLCTLVGSRWVFRYDG